MSHARRAALRLLAALAVLAVVSPGPGLAAEGVTDPRTGHSVAPATAGSPAGDAPSIHYEEALAHAGDVIPFEPGGRVSVPFTPRHGDTLAVDGGRPRRLPPGLASGAEMAASPEGSVWAVPARAPVGIPGSTSGIDQPAVSAGDVVDATRTSALTPLDTASPTPGAVVGAGLSREVFGFLPYWEVSDASTTLDYATLSTIAYFSVGASGSGNLVKQDSDGTISTGWGGWTSSKMTAIIDAAHKAGTRVVLTVSCFAWSSAGATTQANLLGSATARANLANQIAAAVRDRGADGVNLDFEPIVSGYADEFTALVLSVRSALSAVAPGYQLTFDTTGSIGNYPIEAATASGGADAIFIMGYDYRTSSASTAGSISPLTGPRYDLTDTVAAYSARVSPSKLILGVPYYGRAWSTLSDAPNATNVSGTQYGSSSTAVYTTAVDLAAQYGRRYDSIEQAPWTAYTRQTCTSTYGCVTSWRELYYDDAASLKLRYDLVLTSGLRGAGIWALGYDGTRTELRGALSAAFGIAVDPTPAVVTSFTTSRPVTNAATIGWTLSFDRSVSGLSAADFTTAGTASGCVVGSPTGSGATFGVPVSGCSGGTVTLSLLGASVVGSSGISGPSADVAGPTVTIDRTAPSVAAPAVRVTNGPVSAAAYVPVALAWSGADAGGAGVASYEVARSIDGGAYQMVATGLPGPLYTTGLSTSRSYRFEVRAVDAAGNRSGWAVGPSFRMGLTQDGSSAIYRSAGWTFRRSSVYSGGTARIATVARTYVKYTVSARGVGLVMSVGPTRGAVDVYVDGVYAGRIDTYAAAYADRRIVWTRQWGSYGTHVIRVLAAGTSGRPLVVFDAFETYR